MLQQMVADHLKEGEKDRHRPLGFYISFNTSVFFAAAEQYPILTAIALRMAFSVVDTSNSEVDPSTRYKTFVRTMVKYHIIVQV